MVALVQLNVALQAQQDLRNKDCFLILRTDLLIINLTRGNPECKVVAR